MLKRTFLLAQGLKYNNKAQENLFNNMCIFGAREYWRNRIRAVSSYLDFGTIKYKYHLLHSTPVDCITGYTIEGDVGDRDLKKHYRQSMNLIDGSI